MADYTKSFFSTNDPLLQAWCNNGSHGGGVGRSLRSGTPLLIHMYTYHRQSDQRECTG